MNVGCKGRDFCWIVQGFVFGLIVSCCRCGGWIYQVYVRSMTELRMSRMGVGGGVLGIACGCMLWVGCGCMLKVGGGCMLWVGCGCMLWVACGCML